jgi:universal stress protein E
MKQIKKILLCTHPDIFNPDIVDHASEIAKNSQAKIKVFHVIGGYPEDLKQWWNVQDPAQLRDRIQHERETFVSGVVERIKNNSVQNVSSEIRWGKEFVETTREVMRNNHDLVMVTARDMKTISKKIFECPSRELFLVCPCSLWIAKYKKFGIRTKRILAALPGSGSGDVDLTSDGLSTKILESAALIASLEGSDLHVVHALPKYGTKGMTKGRKLRPDLLEFIDELRTKLRDSCYSTLTDYDVTLKQDQVHLLIGDPSEVIPEFANELGLDLIVMGTAARSGLAGLVHGNTAERVLQEVSCSILAIKPDDFNSPVQLVEEKATA